MGLAVAIYVPCRVTPKIRFDHVVQRNLVTIDAAQLVDVFNDLPTVRPPST